MVLSAAYPHYVVTDRYDASAQTLTFDVRQQNPDGLPFRMPVEIEALVDGVSHVVTPTIDRNEQTVVMKNVASNPQMVLFDPNNNILRRLTFEKTPAELAYQLAHAAHVGDREWALNQPGTPPDAVKAAVLPMPSTGCARMPSGSPRASAKPRGRYRAARSRQAGPNAAAKAAGELKAPDADGDRGPRSIDPR